ncbi:hypothetical protein F511_47314 [Dorcoceras hygrometricum]|uniref:Uncharacterized protein n=1 Tax=Dorcoceras hygrometricum TaxID=472368 RepID=A0A2Z6ZSC4_9LAMI|nr:hypothetical protein F511_47314 [Dorcoceras hygrometricum]
MRAGRAAAVRWPHDWHEVDGRWSRGAARLLPLLVDEARRWAHDGQRLNARWPDAVERRCAAEARCCARRRALPPRFFVVVAPPAGRRSDDAPTMS